MVLLYRSCIDPPAFALDYLLCMGTTGVCGGEGAEKAAGGGVLDLPSPSVMVPEPLRTEPSKSANFAAAEFRKVWTLRTLHLNALWWHHCGRMKYLHLGEHSATYHQTRQQSSLWMNHFIFPNQCIYKLMRTTENTEQHWRIRMLETISEQTD